MFSTSHFVMFMLIIPIFYFPLSSEVAAVSDSPDSTPKKDKPANVEVTKVTRPQGRFDCTWLLAFWFLNIFILSFTWYLFIFQIQEKRGGEKSELLFSNRSSRHTCEWWIFLSVVISFLDNLAMIICFLLYVLVCV